MKLQESVDKSTAERDQIQTKIEAAQATLRIRAIAEKAKEKAKTQKVRDLGVNLRQKSENF